MKPKIIYFLLMGVFLLCAQRAGFCAANVIEIDQAKIRLSIALGSAKAGTIKVDNPTNESKHIKVYLEDWQYLPAFDGTKEFKTAGTTDLSCAGWISFVPDDFTIPPYGKQMLNYTVKVPKDAKGGHYAVMFLENYISEQTQPQEGVNVGVSVRIASLFYVEPEGTIVRDAAIEDLKINKLEKEFQITAKLVNKGNTDIISKGNFFLMDKNGIVQARGEFNDLYMFGSNTALLSGSWKESLSEGDYDLVLSVDIGKALEELALGRGPVITEEYKIHADQDGNIQIGEVK